MSSPVSLAVERDRRIAAGQKSQGNAFAALRFRQVPVVDKTGFMGWFAGLLRRRCGGDAVVIGQTFGVTEQTGRNWLAEFACPVGHHVDLAMAMWPEEFIARHAPALQVAA
jgi:hypothetical protein